MIDPETIYVAIGFGGIAFGLIASGVAAHARGELARIKARREADLFGAIEVTRKIRRLETENADLRGQLDQWRPRRDAKGHFIKPNRETVATG